MRNALLFILVVLLVPAAHAAELTGQEVVIPIAGRWAGAHGSQWRTDLTITNTARRVSNPETVFVVLSGHGAPEQTMQTTIAPYASVTIKDVILNGFGLQSGGGVLRIVSQSPTAKITARARIYNTASTAGEYGQTVQALPVTQLAKEALLPGLSGIGVNRTNVGVANPAGVKAGFWISLYDSDGEFRGAYSTEVAPRSVYLINDVFSTFQAGPLDNAMVRITATSGVYAYASVVRSDTGDADFIAGATVEVAPADVPVLPACSAPAPLRMAVTPAEGWIVMYQSGTDAAATTAQLSARYGFTATHVYQDAMQAFHAKLTHAQIASLRCESVVKVVEQNAQVPLP